MAPPTLSLLDRACALFRRGCPDETELAAFAEGAFSQQERLRARIERHLGECGACRSQVAFLVRMQRPASEPLPPTQWMARVEAIASAPARPAREWRWVAAPVAVAAAVVIAVVMWVRVPHSPDRPVDHATAGQAAGPPVVASALREPQVSPAPRRSPDVVRNPSRGASIKVLSPVEGSKVQPGSSIRWRAVEGALYYNVRLLSADGDVIWDAKADRPACSIPPDIRSSTDGKAFLVIHAFLASGKTVESPVVSVRVTSGR